MMPTRRPILAALAAALAMPSVPALADASLTADARQALQTLYKTNTLAKDLADDAVAILIFPDIVKAGLLIGGQTGEGVLFRKGKAVAQYRLTSASYGLQAGVQHYAYALFFLKESALDYLDRSDGWEVGAGPSVVLVDQGFARSMSSTTLRDDVYAFMFGQEGLMAGMGVQGSKISRIGSN